MCSTAGLRCLFSTQYQNIWILTGPFSACLTMEEPKATSQRISARQLLCLGQAGADPPVQKCPPGLPSVCPAQDSVCSSLPSAFCSSEQASQQILNLNPSWGKMVSRLPGVFSIAKPMFKLFFTSWGNVLEHPSITISSCSWGWV